MRDMISESEKNLTTLPHNPLRRMSELPFVGKRRGVDRSNLDEITATSRDWGRLGVDHEETEMNSQFRRWVLVLVSLVLVASACSDGVSPEEAVAKKATEKIIDTEVMKIDKVFKSMEGPISNIRYRLSEPKEDPELHWITGFKTHVLDEAAERPMSWDFNCHANFDIKDLRRHIGKFRKNTSVSQIRLCVISEGQTEVQFPAGFGIPVDSKTELRMSNMALNLDPSVKDADIMFRNSIQHVRDKDIEGEMTPLYPINGVVMVSLTGAEACFNVKEMTPEQLEVACLPGRPAVVDLVEADRAGATQRQFTDTHGQEFTGHWLVPPGREVRRTLITTQMNLQYDTTVHYIIAHMHPYAVSLTLRDVTDDKVLFVCEFKTAKERGNLLGCNEYSSVEGMPIYQDHQYELTSVYNNTADEDQTAMAIMYIYGVDKRFKKPETL